MALGSGSRAKQLTARGAGSATCARLFLCAAAIPRRSQAPRYEGRPEGCPPFGGAAVGCDSCLRLSRVRSRSRSQRPALDSAVTGVPGCVPRRCDVLGNSSSAARADVRRPGHAPCGWLPAPVGVWDEAPGPICTH